MGTDIASQRASLDRIVEKLLKTSDDDRRERLAEDASLECADLAPAVAFELLRSAKKRERLAGAAILGQLCITAPRRVPEFAAALCDALDAETDDNVAVAIVGGLRKACQADGPTTTWTDGRPILPDGHRRDVWPLLGPARSERIAALAQLDDDLARIDVAAALDELDLAQPALRLAFVALLEDEDEYVRSTAFQTAQKRPDADGEEIRAALWRAAEDTDGELRDQALGALLVRHDPKIRTAYEEALRGDASEYLFWPLHTAPIPELLGPLMEWGRAHQATLWTVQTSFPPAVVACGASREEADRLVWGE